MYCLIIKPNAVKMLKEAYEWYEDKRIGLGDEFLDEIDACYDKLELIPEAYQKIKKDIRQIVVKRFPYVLVYEIFEKEIIIYAVFHTSQNPEKKFKQ